ncbi:MAG: DUF924 family protein [Nannocystaceae bacterium]
MPSPRDVLDFWFSDRVSAKWWVKDPDFDAEVAARLGELHRQAAAGALDDWAATAEGALARVLLLDQVPRNIYRDTPAAFASDAQARRATEAALDAGHDAALPEPSQRLFLYLPLEHSESLADQERCVALMAALGNAMWHDYAVRHRDIVARFGRFPHRNAILGRESTAEELAFLEQPGSSF